MIVEVRDDKAVCLVDANDFKRFKLQVSRSIAQQALPARIGGIGKVIDDASVWINEKALRDLGPNDAAWQEGVTAMLAKAAAHGWIDPNTGAVRAHIEWV